MARLLCHILEASGRLAGLAPGIRAAVARSEVAARAVIAVPETDVVVRDWPEWTIASDGVGGFCPRRREIEIALDPDHPGLDFGPGGPLDRTIIHELHHVLRRESVGYGETLGEALVSEGMAGHFVAEVLGTLPEPWETAVRAPELPALAAEALKDWNRPDYDHAEWFFGRGRLPLWLGYALGFTIVGSYLRTHPARKAGGLTDMPARLFIARAEAIAGGDSVGRS